MQIEAIAQKVSQVTAPLIQVFFKDHQVVIPRTIRYHVLKSLINDEKSKESSELTNYYAKDYLDKLNAYGELELETILFSLQETDVLPLFKKLFWQEVISNQYIIGIDDHFFSELALLSGVQGEKESFKEYYLALNEIVADGSGLLDALPYPTTISRIKDRFDYFQIMKFTIKYQFATEANINNLILAYQINKLIDVKDAELSLKKKVLNNLSLEVLKEIALKEGIDLSEEKNLLYAKEFLLYSLENPVIVEADLPTEEIERVVGYYLPLGEQLQKQIAQDEKARYVADLKNFVAKETLLMNNLINYNKNTNFALEMLNNQIQELSKKQAELEEKITIISQYTGVGYIKNYRLKRYLKIAMIGLLWLISVALAIFLYQTFV